MAAILFPLLAAIDLLLLFGASRRAWTQRRAAEVIAAAFVLMLCIDAALLSVGAHFGEGEPLRSLSWARLGLRAIVLPLLVCAAFDLVRRTGLPWTQPSRAGRGVALLCAALASWGLLSLFRQGTLVADRFGGTLRYKSTASAGPALPAIVAMTLLIAFGMMLFRRANRPGLALAAILLFFASIFPVSLVGPTASAIAETMFAIALRAATGRPSQGDLAL